MSLRFKYATFLLFTLLLIACFCWAIVTCYTRSAFLLMICLFGLLYLTTYFLGKRFSKIFFVLSTITFIKRRGGSVSVSAFEEFIENSSKNKAAQGTGQRLSSEILSILIREKIVVQNDETLTLLTP